MPRIKVQAKAAVALGVTVQTLVNWKRQDWWKPEWHTKAGYDVEAIQKRPGAEAETTRKKFDEDARRMNHAGRAIDLRLKQLALDEKSGALVSLKEVREAHNAIKDDLISSMLDIPVRLARLLPEGSVRSKMLIEGDLIVRNALRSYSEGLAHWLLRIERKSKDDK